MMLAAIAIDDEPVARKVLQEFVAEIEYLELTGYAENPLKAMPLLDGHDIDIVFLDINMPKISGIDFLKSSKIRMDSFSKLSIVFSASLSLWFSNPLCFLNSSIVKRLCFFFCCDSFCIGKMRCN